jgi:hypothetical protein
MVLDILCRLAEDHRQPLAEALLSGRERQRMLEMVDMGRSDLVEDEALRDLVLEYYSLKYGKGGEA